MLSDIPLSEDLLHVNICIILLSVGKKGWGIFRSNDNHRYPKTCFLLLHDKHNYGVKDARKVFGVRNICELCHTLYNHSQGCKYYCWLCLPHNHAGDKSQVCQLQAPVQVWGALTDFAECLWFSVKSARPV